MSASEKMKAAAEQVIGRIVQKTAHTIGNRTTEAKGAALVARGKARHVKERAKDKITG
ncbi:MULTISPECIES: hypothetical protein [unclassified Streptomyces]|uniref:hypothetical protein n=1 Tax=unclassified Streptomyces TaxID=2593676 RepID=UPI002E36A9CE|nr:MULTISPECIES: hypothetical protein [unclassified Streptomyces]WUC68132.1 hypothetical protein OG861_29970 [Streptomyces sp. NBC_00539]